MYKKIQSLLNNHLSSLPNSPVVVWENLVVEVPDNEIYLEPKLYLGTKQYKFLGDDTASYQPGIYQINVVSPKGMGWGQPSDLIENLEVLFDRNTILTDTDMTIKIEKVEVNPSLIDSDGRYIIPVSVFFYTYYKN